MAMAGRAELARGLGEEVLALRSRLVDRVAGEAVDGRRVGVEAGRESRVLLVVLMAGEAVLGARDALHRADQVLVAVGFHVLRPVAVAGAAGVLGTRLRILARPAGVGIRRERLDLGLVAVRADRGPGSVGGRFRRRRGRRGGGRGGGLGAEADRGGRQRGRSDHRDPEEPPPVLHAYSLNVRGGSDSYRACILSTEKSASGPWQVAQASPKGAVMENAWAAAALLSWQPRHAVALCRIGVDQSFGIAVARRPGGRFLTTCSVPTPFASTVWHFWQSRRSPGKRTPLKLLSPSANP